MPGAKCIMGKKPAQLKPARSKTVPSKGATSKPAVAKPAKAKAVTAPTQGPKPLYIFSDSTGNLPRHILTAILTQFPKDAFRLEAKNFIRTSEQMDAALKDVAADPGIIFHAILDPAHKQEIEAACAKLKVGSRDLTGPLVDFLAQESGVVPEPDLGALHDVNEAYHRRVKALEFTLEHDDALGLDTLGQADIILVGVSRTSKTPTSVYLAQLGYRVANVAIAIQVAPPVELLKLQQKKVVGLVIQPRVLAEIRARRQEAWRMEATAYTDPREVAREVAWSRDLFETHHWPILDITNQAVEETAARVVHALNLTPPTNA